MPLDEKSEEDDISSFVDVNLENVEDLCTPRSSETLELASCSHREKLLENKTCEPATKHLNPSQE